MIVLKYRGILSEICAKLLLAIVKKNLYEKRLGVTAIEVYDLYSGQRPEVTTELYHMHG